MATKSTLSPDKETSALAKLKLGFEYDITWADARKDVRIRTDQ